MNAECKELKAYMEGHFDIEGGVEALDDAIALTMGTGLVLKIVIL